MNRQMRRMQWVMVLAAAGLVGGLAVQVIAARPATRALPAEQQRIAPDEVRALSALAQLALRSTGDDAAPRPAPADTGASRRSAIGPSAWLVGGAQSPARAEVTTPAAVSASPEQAMAWLISSEASSAEDEASADEVAAVADEDVANTANGETAVAQDPPQRKRGQQPAAGRKQREGSPPARERSQRPERKEQPGQAPPSQAPAGGERFQSQAQPGAAGQRGDGDKPAARRNNPRTMVGERGGPDLSQLLGELDPEAFVLSGAELEVEVVDDTIVLQGSEEDLAKLEMLINLLDQARDEKVLEVVTVSERDASEIARSVEQAIRDAFQTPNMRTEDEVSVTALSSNILLVAALPEQIDFVIQVIKQVDAVPPTLPDVQQMVFLLKNRRASEAAEQLKEIVDKLREKQGARGAEGELQIIANDANNSIMVIAPESERAKIEALLKEIDVEPVKGWGEVKLAIYSLLHSEADELSDTILELLETQQGREATEETIKRLAISKIDPVTGQAVELPPINLERNLRIIPDSGTNSLIVATIEENIEPLGELIALLDGVPVAEELGVQIFPLRFADADTVRELLDDMFSSGPDLTQEADGGGDGRVPHSTMGEALVYNISIVADERTNTLIVSGRQEQMVLVQMIVEEMDVPARALKFPLHLIRLEYADATRVGLVLQDLIEQRIEALEATNAGSAAVERERVFLTVDVRTNTLVLSASEENIREIGEIVKSLDSEPAQVFAQVRVVPCGRLSATDMRDKIDELWERKANLRGETEQLEDPPIVVVDDRSNALVVASSLEDYREIAEMIDTLRTQPAIEATQLFALDHVDALVLSDMLTEVFDGLASQSEAFESPTIVPDARSNTLIIAGRQDALERAQELVDRLDVKAGARTVAFKVYGLRHASAAKLAERIQELFDAREQGQQTEASPVEVLAEESTNSLVALASKDDHLVLADLLGMLDQPSGLASQFDIFPLYHAKADQLVDKLQTLFESQGQGNGGQASTANIEADERTNALLVWASPSEMTNIREVIERLDRSGPVRDMQVRMIRLRQALAEDFAQLLEDTLLNPQGFDEDQAMILTFRQRLEDGSEVVRKLLRQDISITPDPRTNSLMVLAPAESMDMLESMIEEFDQIRPVNSEIRLFQLVNSDAEAMVEQLTELFQTDQGGGGDGEAANQLVFGGELAGLDLASVGQDLRFTADRRTNTILAAGAEVDLRMIEELVRILDAQDTEERVAAVYKARFRGGDQLAQAVQSFIDQEDEPLAELDDQISRLRRAERMVSIEAVGDEDSSNSLLVGVSPRYYNQTMQMLEELDQPEPQVMLRVLIAEVQLQDNLSLGMEFAGQDLDFSEHAVLHPNTGLPIGPDYDYVLGTTLGAAGLGGGQGLSFTMTGEDFSFLLRTFQSNSRLEILSRPVLMVENGREGKISIADQIPVVSNTTINNQGNPQSTVTQEEVGIILTVKPQISPDGYVSIEITQEISNFSGETVQLTEGLSSPVINDRTIESNVTLRDGETVVLGGMIQERKSEGETKVPLVGDLPVIGPLFRTTDFAQQKTELMVVLNVNVLFTAEQRQRYSVEERDKTGLLKNVARSPLMEGLQIKPDESLLGPQKSKSRSGRSPMGSGATRPAPGAQSPAVEPRFGPQPRVYGPVIERPEPAEPATEPVEPAVTTTTAAAGVSNAQAAAVLAEAHSLRAGM